MNSLEIKDTSWHYYIAKRLGTLDSRIDGEMDICSYTRYVLRGLFLLILLLILISVISGLLMMPFVVLIGIYIFHMSWHLLPQMFLPLGILMVAGFFAYGLYWKDKAKQRKMLYPREPGFIRQAYDSWKNKYCVKIKITHE